VITGLRDRQPSGACRHSRAKCQDFGRKFHAFAGKEAVDAAIGPIGRYSEPVEQAWPIVCLNSPRFSYVAGKALWTDGGNLGAVTMGRQPGFELLEGGALES
jgi:hypothetical protein